MTEIDAERAVARAETVSRQAISLQEHPGFGAALNRLERHYLDLFRNSAPTAVEERESAFFMIKALDALRQDVASAATGAAITSRNLRNRR